MLARSSNATAAIGWTGLTCGVMDITAAFLVYGLVYGVRPVHLLQGIAAGLLGPAAAFQGGLATALLGLLCHFVIALGATAVYFVVSGKINVLIEQVIPSGTVYGVAVYFFMQGVVHLSRAVKYQFSLQLMIIGVVIHIFCVGLPIAVLLRRLSPKGALLRDAERRIPLVCSHAQQGRSASN